ncbi:hypothetical protein B0H14DRAFT_1623252 [Mycena olivaceomarginata]|nr:hypothetical protein B0H14DRAFT_1623252 [Mycena olivaceomarginata]
MTWVTSRREFDSSWTPRGETTASSTSCPRACRPTPWTRARGLTAARTRPRDAPPRPRRRPSPSSSLLRLPLPLRGPRRVWGRTARRTCAHSRCRVRWTAQERKSQVVARPRTTAAPTPGARLQSKPTTPPPLPHPCPCRKLRTTPRKTRPIPLPRRHHARPERRRHARPKA